MTNRENTTTVKQTAIPNRFDSHNLCDNKDEETGGTMSTVFLFKLTLVLLLLFIIFNLAKALIEMVREDPDNPDKPTKPMSHYLGRRVMFSALVVILLLIALSSGWLAPNPRPY
ncbi:DUF2909 domain-containing protein [Vibrio parahaemolyticus]|nr:DUF2909 domain-containing protein [Vibrio parahaemolyticus]AWJ81219.1 DUF2909 domain-containing protein [Vibrio parahaemolyticus]EGQ8103532.1 DUF2909 domain-containing protein [Vibrio parahaemolyticus]EGQ8129779.1 DUF2909 domain-containing protein [Vibrio parahaemolyticus]EGQ8135025.1 DUF2909 domain-containing protein [Vibrio parahaemolyticus]